MFDSIYNSVISVDTNAETVHFYYKASDGSYRHDAEGYKARPFDDDFFAKFKSILSRYREKNPSAPIQKPVLILPDDVFFTDIISVPFINKRALDTSLSLAISSTYKNVNELKYNTYEITQNKQIATYGLVGIKKSLLTSIVEVLAVNQIFPIATTFSGNAAANGMFALNPKLKNGSFLLLDIKRDYSKLVFVIKGRTMGSYSLPFGYNVLSRSKLMAEDLLFDHSSGEILVLNAKEKAKAKRLTMGYGVEYEDDPNDEDIGEEDEGNQLRADEDEGLPTVIDIKDGQKKTARRLPKFMLRPTPESEEGYVCENFRIFVKWVLDLIGQNSAITSAGAIDTAYVNLPKGYGFIFSNMKDEKNDGGVTFRPLTADKPEALGNLDLFGALYIKQFNKNNNF